MTKGRKKYETKLTKPENLAPKPIGAKDFNIGKLVFHYHIAKRLHGHFLGKGDKLHLHFGGIISGYDDWFEALSIDQDEFDMVTSKIPRDKIEAEVTANIPLFEKQMKEIDGEDGDKLVLPERNPMAVRAAMDKFDEKIKK